MAKASYEIRDVKRVSDTHVQLEARFFDTDGDVIEVVEDYVDGWEPIDINPYVDESDLRRQLADILRRKVAAQRALEPPEIDLRTIKVEVDD